MTVYEQLVNAAKTVGWTEDSTLSDQQVIKSLLKAVSKTSDEVWKSLPNNVAKWFDDAAAANNTAPHVVPYPDGFVGKEKHEEPVKKDEKKVKAVSPKAGITKPQATRVSGVIDLIRKTLILHTDWTNAQVHKYVQEQGFPALKIETVQVNAGDVRRTIAIIKELGLWKQDHPPTANNQTEQPQEEIDAQKQEGAGDSKTTAGESATTAEQTQA